MALNAGDAYLSIRPTLASDFGRQIARQVQNPAARAGQEASHHFGRGFAKGIGTAGKAIGIGIAAGLGIAVAAAVRLVPVLRQSVQGWRDHLKVVAQTTQTLKTMGGAAHLSVGHITALANALERKTTIDNDVIQSGANLLATFANIRNEVGKGNDVFDRATKAAVDMSVVFKQDMKSSSIQLGKALDNPVKGLTALSRIGVSFSVAEQKQIKSLVAHNKVLEAQKIILGAVERQTAGSAAATVTASDRMSMGWRNLKDTIGKLLLPVVDRFENVLGQQLLPDLDDLARKHGPAVQHVLIGVAKQLKVALQTFEVLGATAGVKALFPPSWSANIDQALAGLKQVGPRLKELWQEATRAGPAFSSAGGGAHVFADSMAIIGPVLDVVARNIHNVLPWLPTLVAGFLAFRAVRTVIGPLGDLGTAIRNFATPALVVATFAQARAQHALAAAMRETAVSAVAASTAQAEANVVGQAGLVLAVRERAAALAAAAAQRVAAGGLLTSLGLVGAAAGVLAVLLAKMNSELHKAADESDRTGRAMTLGGKGGQLFADRLGEMGAKARDAAAATAAAARAAEQHTRNVNAERQSIQALNDALDAEQTGELDVRQAKLNVSSAQARLTELTRSGRKGSLEYQQAQIDLKRAQMDLKARTAEYKEAQLKANAATGGAMRASQDAQPPMRGLGGASKTTATRLLDMGLKSGRAAQEVAGLKQSIAALRSKVLSIKATASLTGFGALGGTALVAAAHGRAGGGPIVDGVRSRDSTLVMVRKDEHVWTPEEVDAVGGHGAMYRMRADALAGQFRGYAGGGAVTGSDSFTGIAEAARGVRGIPAVVERIVTRASLAIVRRAVKAIEAGFGGMGTGGLAGIKRFILSTDRLPYRWGAAGPGAYDCSGLVGAVALAMRGRPYGHGQRVWTTGSIHPGILGLKTGFGGLLNIGVTAGSGHMAGNYGGLGFEARSTATGIFTGRAARSPATFARHFHMAKGGAVEWAELLARLPGLDVAGDASALHVVPGRFRGYDAGGWLQPGWTMAYNGTGRAEPVGRTAAGTINVTVPLTIYGDVTAAQRAQMRQIAEDMGERVAAELSDALARRGSGV